MNTVPVFRFESTHSITDQGIVTKNKSGKVLSTYLMLDRYPAVSLDKNRVIARLVAESFLPSWRGKKFQIKYKDGNPANYVLTNLCLVSKEFELPDTQEGETWLDIPDFEGFYQASSMGRIRRTVGTIIKPCLVGNRKLYLQVKLSVNGVSHSAYVATLVAKAFLGNPPTGAQINHKNFNTRDNSIENLEWVTASENVQKSADAGRPHSPGGLAGFDKRVNPFKVAQILTLHLIGWSALKITEFTGIAHATVLTLVKQRTKIAKSVAKDLGIENVDSPSGTVVQIDGMEL